MLMAWFCALNRKTSRVDTMTDAKGAHTEIQNNFGHLMLTCLATSRSTRKHALINIVCEDHSLVCWKTEAMTGTMPSN